MRAVPGTPPALARYNCLRAGLDRLAGDTDHSSSAASNPSRAWRRFHNRLQGRVQPLRPCLPTYPTRLSPPASFRTHRSSPRSSTTHREALHPTRHSAPFRVSPPRSTIRSSMFHFSTPDPFQLQISAHSIQRRGRSCLLQQLPLQLRPMQLQRPQMILQRLLAPIREP